MRYLLFTLAFSIFALFSCDCGPAPTGDAGIDDAGATDAGLPDAGLSDSGTPDAGVPDSGLLDAGSIDAGRADAGSHDAGHADAGHGDAGAFDSGLPDSGTSDAGLPTDGGLGWARVIGADGWDDVAGLAVHPGGDVFIAGQLDFSVDLGCGTLSGPTRDAYLARFSGRDGGCQWSSRWGGPLDDEVAGLAYDSARDLLYIGGSFRYDTGHPVHFGGAPLSGWANNEVTPYIAAYRPTAQGPQHQWSTRLVGEGTARYLAPTHDGVIAAGFFNLFLEVNDAGVTRCCVDGEGAWLASFGDDGGTRWGTGVRASANGIDSVYPTALWVGGDEVNFGFSSSVPMELGSTSLAANAYVARFALDGGAPRGISTFGRGDAGVVAAQGVIREPNGTLTLAGTVWHETDLGTGPLVGWGWHLYVARATAQGQITSARTYFVEHGSVFGFVKDAQGRYVLLGDFRGTQKFGNFTLTSGSSMDGTEDPMILVFSPDLSTVLHAESFQTEYEDITGYLGITPWGSWVVAQPFGDFITVRGHTFTGPQGWNVLLMELR